MSDLIDRQAVNDLISKFIIEIHTEGGRDLNAHTNDVLRQILRNINSDEVLPSVNPQEPNMTWITGSDGAKIAFKDVPVWKVTKICEILGDPQESEGDE